MTHSAEIPLQHDPIVVDFVQMTSIPGVRSLSVNAEVDRSLVIATCVGLPALGLLGAWAAQQGKRIDWPQELRTNVGIGIVVGTIVLAAILTAVFFRDASRRRTIKRAFRVNQAMQCVTIEHEATTEVPLQNIQRLVVVETGVSHPDSHPIPQVWVSQVWLEYTTVVAQRPQLILTSSGRANRVADALRTVCLESGIPVSTVTNSGCMLKSEAAALLGGRVPGLI